MNINSMITLLHADFVKAFGPKCVAVYTDILHMCSIVIANDKLLVASFKINMVAYKTVTTDYLK